MSAQRDNFGKPPVHFLPLAAIGEHLRDYVAGEVLEALAVAQFPPQEPLFEGRSTPRVAALSRAFRAAARWAAVGKGRVLRYETLSVDELSAWRSLLLATSYVLEFGARKYGPHDWLKGQRWSTPLAAAVRHALAAFSGEWRDAESNQPHVAHLAANILLLQHYALSGTGEDDLSPATALGEPPLAEGAPAMQSGGWETLY